METIYELSTKKRRYQNLRSNIYTIISNLDSAIESLEIPSKKIKNAYNIDSIAVDNGKIGVVRQNLIDRKNYLSDTILYAINKEIRQIEIEIESAG